VRQPPASLPLVHAEPLEAPLEIVRELGGPTTGVLEDDHAGAAGLTVAGRREADLARLRGSLAKHFDDRSELAGRSVAEKGERDVQMPAWDDAHAGELPLLPVLDLVENVVGRAQREEEPESFISRQASGPGHAASS